MFLFLDSSLILIAVIRHDPSSESTPPSKVYAGSRDVLSGLDLLSYCHRLLMDCMHSPKNVVLVGKKIEASHVLVIQSARGLTSDRTLKFQAPGSTILQYLCILRNNLSYHP